MIKLYDAKITDGLPRIINEQAWVQALASATQNQIRKVLDFAAKTRAFAYIDDLEEPVLDDLAIELCTPLYRQTYPIEVKRQIVKNSLVYFSRAGTTAAVTELLQDIYCGAVIEEWFEYSGQPGRFRIILDITQTQKEVSVFSTDEMELMIYSVKRGSAHLDGVYFMIRHPISLGHVCNAWLASPPQCGEPYCGTENEPSTIGYSLAGTTILGRQIDPYAVSPDPCGTLPEPSTIGISSAAETSTGGTVTAYATQPAQSGARQCGQSS
jgi:phage tail P2-like protein